MNAEQLKDSIVKCLAERRALDEFSSGRDLTTVDEFEEMILDTLRKAGFTRVKSELNRQEKTELERMYPSMYSDE